ncbi:MAG: DUF2085 domain-containing protein [Thermoplasmata archaeon]|nr:MAG: DUF2085 domain-containing protein [Thermoplasmata archaeon]
MMILERGTDCMKQELRKDKSNKRQVKLPQPESKADSESMNSTVNFFSFLRGNIVKFHFFKINLIMFLICFIWVAILFIVPAMLPSDSVDLGEDGVTGVRPLFEDNEEQIKEINNSFAESIYNFGDSSCHQLARRSLFINGNQMPVCARDLGIYIGFAIGALVVTVMVVELRLWWIIGALIPIGLDGGIQALTSYESNNVLRLITGGLTGMMTTMVLGIMFYEIYTTYKENKQETLDRMKYERKKSP